MASQTLIVSDQVPWERYQTARSRRVCTWKTCFGAVRGHVVGVRAQDDRAAAPATTFLVIRDIAGGVLEPGWPATRPDGTPHMPRITWVNRSAVTRSTMRTVAFGPIWRHTTSPGDLACWVGVAHSRRRQSRGT